MLPIHRILVPIDFTDSCRAAARFALDLASQHSADLLILHVVEPTGTAMGFESAIVIEDTTRAHRRHACQELESFLNLQASEKLQRLLVDGDPATEIIKLAHDEKVDLILMPTHGYGVVRRFLLGSVTAKVLHDAECPVWSGVHPERFDAQGTIDIHNVVCAVDGGPQTRSVLRWAAACADNWNARLTIVHVLPAERDPNWRETLSRNAREQLTGEQHELGIKAELIVEFGKVPATVLEAASRFTPDVLVIGRGHPGSIGRLGGSAYAFVRDATCPVVSV